MDSGRRQKDDVWMPRRESNPRWWVQGPLSYRLDDRAIGDMEPSAGVEPAAWRVETACSASELRGPDFLDYIGIHAAPGG